MSNTTPATNKVWKVSRTSAASVMASETAITIAGSDEVALVVDNRGITLAGPISIVADARSIRKGGLFVGLDDFAQMIPSTIVTPLPNQIPLPPINGLVNLSKDIAFFMSLLA